MGDHRRFHAFARECHVERPHEVLDMKCPAELYAEGMIFPVENSNCALFSRG